MKVIKFGGSSLADGAAVAKAVAIIAADPERRVIVTSAPGRRHPGDPKVTDLLIDYARATLDHQDPAKIQAALFARYQAIGEHFRLPVSDLAPIQAALINLPRVAYPNADYLMAAFKAHGERLNTQLLARILSRQGLPARYLDPLAAGLRVSGTPNNATIMPESYRRLAQLDYDPTIRLVVPGFFGFTLAGHVATFSRGGSDITGAILARGLGARTYENFTDVDAIYTANPAVVAHPQPLQQLTYREMRELSYAGFGVFHDEALIPAIEGQIPIVVKNTNAPEKPGTRIVPEQNFQPADIVTGIAGGKHFAALYLHKYLLNKENGFTLRILTILNRHGISYEHMPSGIDDITIVFDRHQVTDAQIDQVCAEIQEEINPDRLEWIGDYAITMIVGEGMKNRTGVIADILSPLAAAQIPVQMINQGASRIAVMLGTRAADADRAVQAIYHRFFIN